MGEARRRRDAYAEGKPWRPPRVCPNCRSICIERATLPPTGLSHCPTDYDLCRECGTVWEAYPANWCEDVVGAEPCDNCAFRPGAPEQRDPAAWKNLIDKLRAGGEFRCHKGAPIKGLTNPFRDDATAPPIEFDADWINRHGRQCAGFMRMVWALREKGEDWLAARYKALGIDDA